LQSLPPASSDVQEPQKHANKLEILENFDGKSVWFFKVNLNEFLFVFEVFFFGFFYCVTRNIAAI